MARLAYVAQGSHLQNMTRFIPADADGLWYVPKLTQDKQTVLSFDVEYKRDLSNLNTCVFDSEDEVEGMSFIKSCHEGTVCPPMIIIIIVSNNCYF